MYVRPTAGIINSVLYSSHDSYSQSAHSEHLLYRSLHLYVVMIYSSIIWCDQKDHNSGSFGCFFIMSSHRVNSLGIQSYTQSCVKLLFDKNIMLISWLFILCVRRKTLSSSSVNEKQTNWLGPSYNTRPANQPPGIFVLIDSWLLIGRTVDKGVFGGGASDKAQTRGFVFNWLLCSNLLQKNHYPSFKWTEYWRFLPALNSLGMVCNDWQRCSTLWLSFLYGLMLQRNESLKSLADL